MAKKEKLKNKKALPDTKTQDKKKPDKPKKSKKKLIFFLVFFLIIAAGGGGGAYFFLFKNKSDYTKINSDFFEVPQKTDLFTYNSMPQIHLNLKEINKSIVLINKEIQRIQKIENEYPDQKQITQKKIKALEKLNKRIDEKTKGIIKDLNEVYVNSLVNSNINQEYLANQASKIKTNSESLLKEINDQTAGFKDKHASGSNFIQKIIQKFKK